MFKNGFILNFPGGSKGDFLIRFISNTSHNLTENGKTVPLYQFDVIKRHFREYYLSERFSQLDSKSITQFILNLKRVWPYTCHDLHYLETSDIEKIINSYADVYDLIVEKEYQTEVLLNEIFKNYSTTLTMQDIELLNKHVGEYKWQYAIDSDMGRSRHAPTFNFTDDSRIEWLLDFVNNRLHTRYNFLNNYTDAQLASSTKKIYYSKLFYPPFDDLKSLYKKINKKSFNEDEFIELLKRTQLPKEMIYFNHKISIDPTGDVIMKVLEKVKS